MNIPGAPMSKTQARLALSRRLVLGAGLAAVGAGPAFAERKPLVPPPALGPLAPSWLNAEVIPLWPGRPPNGDFRTQPVPAGFPPGFFRNVAKPSLHVFRPAKSNGRAVLTAPGGAYSFVVGTHEGAAVAEALAARGYTVFVLIYRLPGEGWSDFWDVPLQDAQRAMRLVRANAARFGFDPAQVAALGFSAGGHLIASLATDHAETLYPAGDAADALGARPSAVGLIYPVITLETPYTNPQTRLSLLGPSPSADLVARRSPQRHVSAATPPCFLVHALDDTAVPPQNSLMMLEALRTAGVRAEAHFLEEGGHGFGLGSPEAPDGQWLGLFDLWLGRAMAG